MEEDIELINQFLDGNKSVFNDILKKYKPYVFTLCISLLKNREVSEEVFQDVFVKVYFSIEKFRFKSTLKTWLYKITYNSCIEKLRKDKREIILDYEIVDIKDDYSNGFEADNTKIFLRLKKCLSELKPIESMVLTLFYMDGLTINEISEITSLKYPTIKTILFRGRNNLSKKLNSKING